MFNNMHFDTGMGVLDFCFFTFNFFTLSFWPVGWKAVACRSANIHPAEVLNVTRNLSKNIPNFNIITQSLMLDQVTQSPMLDQVTQSPMLEQVLS